MLGTPSIMHRCDFLLCFCLFVCLFVCLFLPSFLPFFLPFFLNPLSFSPPSLPLPHTHTRLPSFGGHLDQLNVTGPSGAKAAVSAAAAALPLELRYVRGGGTEDAPGVSAAEAEQRSRSARRLRRMAEKLARQGKREKRGSREGDGFGAAPSFAPSEGSSASRASRPPSTSSSFDGADHEDAGSTIPSDIELAAAAAAVSSLFCTAPNGCLVNFDARDDLVSAALSMAMVEQERKASVRATYSQSGGSVGERERRNGTSIAEEGKALVFGRGDRGESLRGPSPCEVRATITAAARSAIGGVTILAAVDDAVRKERERRVRGTAGFAALPRLVAVSAGEIIRVLLLAVTFVFLGFLWAFFWTLKYTMGWKLRLRKSDGSSQWVGLCLCLRARLSCARNSHSSAYPNNLTLLLQQTHEDNAQQAFWGERGCPALFFGFELPRFISWVSPFGRSALDRARTLGGSAVAWMLGRGKVVEGGVGEGVRGHGATASSEAGAVTANGSNGDAHNKATREKSK